jgi:hypothetical protein
VELADRLRQCGFAVEVGYRSLRPKRRILARWI